MEWNRIIIREWKGMEWNRMYLSKGNEWNGMELSKLDLQKAIDFCL